MGGLGDFGGEGVVGGEELEGVPLCQEGGDGFDSVLVFEI